MKSDIKRILRGVEANRHARELLNDDLRKLLAELSKHAPYKRGDDLQAEVTKPAIRVSFCEARIDNTGKAIWAIGGYRLLSDGRPSRRNEYRAMPIVV